MTAPDPLAGLAALLKRIGPPPVPKTFHGHPAAVDALMSMSVPAEPGPLGSIGSLTDIPVILDDTLPVGAWEIREGDTVISSGTVRTFWSSTSGPAPEGEQP